MMFAFNSSNTLNKLKIICNCWEFGFKQQKYLITNLDVFYICAILINYNL